jgi:hypothetical protein
MAWITIDGERYKLLSPNDMTLDELCQASDMGAEIPTSEQSTLNPRWVKAIVVIVKQRAGEVVNAAAIGELTFGQLTFEEDEVVNGGPPANRAARRANGKKANGSSVSAKSSRPAAATHAGSGQ